MKNLIIIAVAIIIITIAVHFGVRIFTTPFVEQGISEKTIEEMQEWYYHNEHVYYAEMPMLGGDGRDRIVSLELSRRYDIILHRYEIGRYSFEQKVNYLLTEIFPYSIHMVANRSLMRANVAFNSRYDILVIPSDDVSIAFVARAEEYGYSLFPVRVFNTRVIDIRATEEGEIHFFLDGYIEIDSWENLKEKVED